MIISFSIILVVCRLTLISFNVIFYYANEKKISLWDGVNIRIKTLIYLRSCVTLVELVFHVLGKTEKILLLN